MGERTLLIKSEDGKYAVIRNIGKYNVDYIVANNYDEGNDCWGYGQYFTASINNQ